MQMHSNTIKLETNKLKAYIIFNKMAQFKYTSSACCSNFHFSTKFYNKRSSPLAYFALKFYLSVKISVVDVEMQVVGYPKLQQ